MNQNLSINLPNKLPVLGKRLYWFAVALFAGSLLVRLIIFGGLIVHDGTFDAFVYGDGSRYYSLAESVVNGEGYIYEDGLEAYRPPGYPAYLMFFLFFGLPMWFAVLVQLIIASFIPVAVLFVAVRYLRLPLWVAAIAGFFAALEPVQVFYSVTLTPDVFFAVCFLGSLYFLVRYFDRYDMPSMVFAGLLLGISNYFRPAGLYLVLVLGASLLFLVWFRKKFSLFVLGHVALFVGVMVLCMFPWMVRNQKEFGSFAFVSSDAYLLYAYAAAQSIAVAENRSYNDVKAELMANLRANAPDGSRPTSLRNRDWILTQSKEVLKEYPLEYIRGVFLGINTVFFSGNYHYLLMKYGLIERPERVVSYSLVLSSKGVSGLLSEIRSQITESYLLVAILGKLFWIFFVLLAGLGAWYWRKYPLAIFFFASFFYFAATTLATTIGVEARHRYALNPLIFLFASAVVYLFYEKNIRRRSSI